MSNPVADAVAAVETLTRSLQPCARTRSMTLAEHDFVLGHLETVTRSTDAALVAFGQVHTAMPSITDAARHVRVAAGKCAEAHRVLHRDVVSLPGGSPDLAMRRALKPCRAAAAAAEAAGRMAGVIRTGRRFDVADLLWQVVTDTHTTFSYEAMGLGWAYEERRLTRRDAQVSGELISALADLRHAATCLDVTRLILRDL